MLLQVQLHTRTQTTWRAYKDVSGNISENWKTPMGGSQWSVLAASIDRCLAAWRMMTAIFVCAFLIHKTNKKNTGKSNENHTLCVNLNDGTQRRKDSPAEKYIPVAWYCGNHSSLKRPTRGLWLLFSPRHKGRYMHGKQVKELRCIVQRKTTPIYFQQLVQLLILREQCYNIVIWELYLMRLLANPGAWKHLTNSKHHSV